LATNAAAGQPTRASWAAAGNRHCAVANAQVRALPKATTRAPLIADIRHTLVIAKRLTRELGLIPKPSHEVHLIGELLANSRKQDSIVQRQLLPALIKRQAHRVQRAATELKPLGTRYNKIARTLGARICAESPTPSG
jgi:hypothetical protein